MSIIITQLIIHLGVLLLSSVVAWPYSVKQYIVKQNV